MSNKDMLDFKNLKPISPNKIRTLNPNAAEFVPSSFQSLPINTTNAVSNAPGTSGKVTSELSLPNGSKSLEDDAHQYWLQQLPDDITPDFRIENGLKLSGNLSLSGLSLNEGNKPSQFTVSRDSQLSGVHAISPQTTNGDLNEFSRYRNLDYSGKNVSLDAMNASTKLWDAHYSSDAASTEGSCYDGALNGGFINDVGDENADVDNTSVDPVDLLASNFPGFASECLADIYYANGCDLNLTIEILTQLELQVDGGFNQNIIPRTPSAPNFSSLDFPSLPISEAENTLTNYCGSDAPRSSERHRSIDKGTFSFLNFSSSNLKGTQDFASAVRKHVSQDASYWKPEVNSSADKLVGSSRGPVQQSGSFSMQGKSIFGDKIRNNGREAPLWLETGDAVGNLYLESREEARELARVRNACFDQASQAYLIGNKALAKELSEKGKWYGMQMELAHEKARELIYKQRNPIAPEVHSYYRGKELMIDLHGLHVSEAIYVLKHEMGVLRKTARSAGQRLQVLICVGTGHHTKGSRTPARLPVAVEKYLLDERLQYSEPQSGLFRVVVH